MMTVDFRLFRLVFGCKNLTKNLNLLTTHMKDIESARTDSYWLYINIKTTDPDKKLISQPLKPWYPPQPLSKSWITQP